MAEQDILQFVPFSSFVHPSFWHKLAELKIDVDRLDDGHRTISGIYSNTDSQGAPGKCLLEVDYTAFNSEFCTPNRYIECHGTIANKNTIEEFRECDKTQLMQAEADKVIAVIKSGEWMDDPSLLVRFLILSYADLKKFDFYYCFGFPAPLYEHAKVLPIEEGCGLDVAELAELVDEKDPLICGFIKGKDGKLEKKPIREIVMANEQDQNCVYYAFNDPSNDDRPGWPLRVIIAALLHSSPHLTGKIINIIGLRNSRRAIASESKLFRIRLPNSFSLDDIKWLGWELTAKGKFAPKMAAMGTSMDPAKLAESSTNLNLKLMKWRLMPDLNLDSISSKKCLLFGAGTLGCGVARSLLAWGVRHITFVDSGKVSYSNPVRQNLFRHEDAVNSRPKAETAAQRLSEICPGANVKGVSVHIPMPGHSVSDSMRDECEAQFKTIEELVKENDVLFLLTDSRESRWLPTVLGRAHGKLVMNSALGFDSYLVMRHGCAGDAANVRDKTKAVQGFKCIAGEELGCYFCNDIVAPGNSLKDRTLDQQCTVTRPAVSNIASSLVVELFVALTQNELKGGAAPAYIRDPRATDVKDVPEGLLGVIPHSIRGRISNYEQILPATERFSKCIACSGIVINAYNEQGFELALSAFNSSRFLEDLTGITELLKDQESLFECNDDGDDFELSD